MLEHQTLDISNWRKIDEVPFDFERRRVSVLVDDGTSRLLIVKGAPEDIIRLSSTAAGGDGEKRELDEEARRQLVGIFERLGEEGYRVLAVASREAGPGHNDAVVSDETELTFAGFAVFVDPPKADAAQAIRDLGSSGCAVKILTGDNERITRHICDELGIAVQGVMTGDELSRIGQDALRARLGDVNLFAV